MEKNAERTKVEWISVPAFGDWDNQKGTPDYSLDFSKVRQIRKQNKSDFPISISIGNDEDLLHGSNIDEEFYNRSKIASVDSPSGAAVTREIHHRQSPSRSGRKKRLNYFICCIRT